MSNERAKNIQNPQTVAEAVTHLRRQLKLSMEKFAARVGCSFQTVHRWESGRAKVTEANLVRLWELAREHAPLAEPVFANATPTYRKLLEGNSAFDTEAKHRLRHEILSHAEQQIETIDRAVNLITSGNQWAAEDELTAMRQDLERWMNRIRRKKELR